MGNLETSVSEVRIVVLDMLVVSGWPVIVGD